MDIDGDGHLDLFSGSYNEKGGSASIYWFRHRGHGDFEARRELSGIDGKALDMARAKSVNADDVTFRRANAVDPAWADIDGDGDFDLFVGGMEGEIFFVRNEGDRRTPRLAPVPVLVKHGGRPIRVHGGEASPAVADWDGDGILDLLSGSSAGAVFFFRGTGEKDVQGTPFFAEGRIIIAAPKKRAFIESDDEIKPGGTTRIAVVDWNGDGRSDLLVGDHQTIRRFEKGLTPEQIATARRCRTELEPILAKDAAFALARDQRMWTLGYRPKDAFEKAGDEIDAIEALTAPIEEKLKPLVTDPAPAGFVWVFLRKP